MKIEQVAHQEATGAAEFWRKRCRDTEDRFGAWRPDVSPIKRPGVEEAQS